MPNIDPDNQTESADNNQSAIPNFNQPPDGGLVIDSISDEPQPLATEQLPPITTFQPPQPPQPPIFDQNFVPPNPIAEVPPPPPIVGQSQFVQPTQAPVPTSSGRSKKKLSIILSVLVMSLLIGGGAGYVFGFYIPNKPENVWKTSIAKTGEVIDRIVVASTEKDKLELYKKTQVTSIVDYRNGTEKFSGNFDIKFDDTKVSADGTINTDSRSMGKINLSGKMLAEVATGSQYPNTYLQVSGFTPLGLDNYLPGISALDGKWIAIEEPFLKSLNLPLPQGTINENNITSADSAELVRAISTTSNKYLFSTAPETGVFEMSKFVAKEKLENDMEAYHYEVKLNEKNTIAYCKALVETMFETSVYKKMLKSNSGVVNTDKNASMNRCDSTWTSRTKELDSLDIWIDAKYKLMHKIRIKNTQAESANKDSYMDIGQNYKGGDDISMFVKYYEKDQLKGSFTVDSNLKTNTTKAVFNYSEVSSSSPTTDMSMTITFEIKSLEGDINVSKPEGAIPIEDILKNYGVEDPATLFGGSRMSEPAPMSEEQLTEQRRVLEGQTGAEPKLILGEQTQESATEGTQAVSAADFQKLIQSLRFWKK